MQIHRCIYEDEICIYSNKQCVMSDDYIKSYK